MTTTTNASDAMLALATACVWACMTGNRCARDSVCNGQKTFDDCDDSELCQILDASFRGDAKEWIEHDDGRTECTAFVPLGAAQPQRDDRVGIMK